VGYLSLAQWILTHDEVIIDGYSGVLWDDVYFCLNTAFENIGAKVRWVFASNYLKPADQLDELVRPFLGSEDSIWGKRCTHSLADFFDIESLQSISKDETDDCTIVLGAGAALCNLSAPVIYLDVPKNEIQYRMRAGVVANLGATWLEVGDMGALVPRRDLEGGHRRARARRTRRRRP